MITLNAKIKHKHKFKLTNFETTVLEFNTIELLCPSKEISSLSHIQKRK